ncbi:MAG: extracellular solute-binding protein, partial [Ruminococcus sp.]|nr:extracellular solute-binding protein [Ruminococcus sp.]
MNRIIALILSIILVISLAACSTTTVKEDKESAEVVVFAAASMTETLEEIEKSYITAHPDVKLTFNFDSSGTLKTQIEEGADCDVFISAGQKQMNELDILADEEKNPDRLDFV